MYVWFVSVFDDEGFVDTDEPFISAERAMSDVCYKHLDWKYIQRPKFDGTIMEHWQAEYEGRDYILDKEHVIGSDDE